MKTLRYFIFIAATTFVYGGAHSQASAPNPNVLRKYMAPAQINRLEWELIQFNLHWTQSFSTAHGSYFTSLPVFFDYRKNRFCTTVLITERREYRDPEPWSVRPKLTKEAELRDVVQSLTTLLGNPFPELKVNPGLLFVDFQTNPTGRSAVIAAKYENGTLTIAE